MSEEKNKTQEEFTEYLVSYLREKLPDCAVSVKNPNEIPVTESTRILVVEKSQESRLLFSVNRDLAYSLFIEYGMEKILLYIDNVLGTFLADENKEIACNFDDFDKIKDRLFIRALNYDLNVKVLERAVYKESIGDIVLVLYIFMKTNSPSDVLSYMVPYSAFQKWGKNLDEIFSIAEKNTIQNFPLRFYEPEKSPVWDKYAGDSFLCRDCMLELDNHGVILSNENQINGATLIFIPDITEKISQLIGGDFFFVSTSIHKCTIYALSKDIAEMKKMVNETIDACISEKSMDEKEILSRHVFRYDLREKKFIVVS